MLKVIVLVALLIVTARAEIVQPDPAISSHLIETIENIAPGLTHHHVHSDSSRSGAPISIHILRADLDSIEIRPVLAAGQIIGQK